MNPLHGVLHSHCLEAFSDRFGLNEAQLEADFSGWHKRVILSPTSAFLFPRYETDVAQIDREAAALEVLAADPLVPNLKGRWSDDDISPHPFLESERRYGTSYEQLEDDLSFEQICCVLERLGAATASWHAIDVDALPELLASPPEPDERMSVDRFSNPSSLREELERACAELAAVLPDDVAPPRASVDRWEQMLRPLAALPHVLTHGDIHETQILLDDALELVAVLDWDHAGVAHPTRDFNFGEWGFGIFEWEDHFDELYRRYWDGYRSASALETPDHRSLVLLRTLRDAVYFVARVAEDRTWFNAYRLRRNAEHVRAVTDAFGT